jgi:prolyl-tRNA synthetase
MQDGKALQICTSHVLSHSFPASFDVKFQDKDGNMQVPFCTSWGVSMGRLIGAMIMIHGDQNGLVIPPKIAPIQAVIVPIYKTDSEKMAILEKAKEIKQMLAGAGYRIQIDDDEQKSPGAKYFHWDLRGVPTRIEIGPKDLEKKQVVIVNRVEEDKTKRKMFVSVESLVQVFADKLVEIQKQMFEKAKNKRISLQHDAETLEEVVSKIEPDNGMFQVGWCGGPECEQKLKEFKATIRCVTKENKHKKCFACSGQSKNDVLIAKAY